MMSEQQQQPQETEEQRKKREKREKLEQRKAVEEATKAGFNTIYTDIDRNKKQ